MLLSVGVVAEVPMEKPPSAGVNKTMMIDETDRKIARIKLWLSKAKDKACVESWLNRRNLQVGLVGYWYLLVPFNHALGA